MRNGSAEGSAPLDSEQASPPAMSDAKKLQRYEAALRIIASNTTGKNAMAIARYSVLVAREALEPGYAETATLKAEVQA